MNLLSFAQIPPFRPRRRGIKTAFALGSLTVAVAACSLFGAGDAPTPLDASARRARIENLRQAIQSDHETLESLITQPTEEATVDLHRNPVVETIATRLGRHERELARLVELEGEAVQ